MADVLRTNSSGVMDNTYFLKKAVPTLQKRLVMGDYIMPAELPPTMGGTARWFKDNNIAVGSVTSALDHASGGNILYATREAKNEVAFSTNAIDATIYTYGAFIPVRRKDLDILPKSTMDRIGDRLGYLGNLVLDTLYRAAVDGSGTGFNPSMGAGTTTTRKSIGDGTNDTTLSTTDFLTAEDIALGVNDLRQNDAEEFDNGFMTVVIHSGAEIHVITDVSATRLNWQEVSKHVSGTTGQEKITKGTIGGVAGGLAVRSNNISTSTVDSETAYNNLILAEWALGGLSMGDMDVDIFVNKSGEQSVSDPHRMFSTIAFQFTAAPKLLDSDRCEVLYSKT